MSGQYDFLVIGGDEASLCAAASAAKAGARTALLRIAQRKKQSTMAATSAIPNFVWRRLDLQEYDLLLEPASARVTLFKEGDPFVTYANGRATSDALAERGVDDHFVWTDFIEEVAALSNGGALKEPYATSTPASGKALAALLSDPAALDRAARLHGPCADLVDDYFTDAQLKAHVSAHALSLAGAGDRDAGSASAVAEFFQEESWRMRTPKDATSLLAVLEQVCKDAGVDSYSGKVTEVVADGAKHASVTIGAEEKLKVRHIFFATPDAAAAAGVRQNGAAHASFTVRFKLSDRIEPPAGDDGAIFQIIDDGEDIREARAAAVNGKLFDGAPVEFEFTPNGEIIARTSYFPAAFYEDGDWRGWTGQDRQAAAAIIKKRIAERLPDFTASVRRTETEVTTPLAGRSHFENCSRIIVQPHRHSAISAAVRLIDEVMTGNE